MTGLRICIGAHLIFVQISHFDPFLIQIVVLELIWVFSFNPFLIHFWSKSLFWRSPRFWHLIHFWSKSLFWRSTRISRLIHFWSKSSFWSSYFDPNSIRFFIRFLSIFYPFGSCPYRQLSEIIFDFLSEFLDKSSFLSTPLFWRSYFYPFSIRFLSVFYPFF